MARKIIQLVNAESDLTALCDDGTIWQYRYPSWNKIDPVPQDEPEAVEPPPALEPPRRWPPAGISKLWAITLDGSACTPVADAKSCGEARTRGSILVEAFTMADAMRVYRDRHDTDAMVAKQSLRLGGTPFEYFSDDLPF